MYEMAYLIESMKMDQRFSFHMLPYFPQQRGI